MTTKSPWAGLDPASLSAEDIEKREGCIDIMTRLSELLQMMKSDGTVDDFRAIKLSLLLACFVAHAMKRPESTKSDVKCVLQLCFDEAFHVADEIITSAKEPPPL